ncbi:MAG: energy-coupling factor transporter ATPase [Oscillospiraceae bacterium]|nr:energy-coupling factor transporter ATPase [Oscillospiraceae bacterium]
MNTETIRQLIHIENLYFTYRYIAADSANAYKDGGCFPVYPDPEYVLKNINLDITEGSFTVILGHNGSGKSTLAKLMNMILSPTEGKIYINNLDTSAEDNVTEVRRIVGMVFQNPDNQLVAAIVEEDVAFGPENLGVEPPEIRKRVDEALETVGMSEYKLHAPHKLSGGQKQRIAIAGVIALSPKIIILDESTAMLDPAGRKEVLNTVKRLNTEKNMTVILITHYMNEAVMADRVIVLNKGEIYLDGTPKYIFSQFDKIKKAGLDVPQVTELMYMLNEEQKSNDKLKKYAFPTDILHTKEAADIIESQV